MGFAAIDLFALGCPSFIPDECALDDKFDQET